MNRAAGIAAGLVVGVLAGFVGACYIFVGRVGGQGFWDMRAIEVVQVAVSVAVAFVIGLLWSSFASRDMKVRELIADGVSDFQKLMRDIIECGCSCIATPTREKRERLIRQFWNAETELCVLIEAAGTGGKDLLGLSKGRLKDNFWGLKRALTDTPREGQPQPAEELQREAQRCYRHVTGILQSSKIRLYVDRGKSRVSNARAIDTAHKGSGAGRGRARR